MQQAGTRHKKVGFGLSFIEESHTLNPLMISDFWRQRYTLFYYAHKKRTVFRYLSAQISHARAFSVLHIARVMTRRLLR